MVNGPGRANERIAQYYVDVPDDEQIDVMCILSFPMAAPLRHTSGSALLRLANLPALALFNPAYKSFSVIHSCCGLALHQDWKDVVSRWDLVHFEACI